MITNKNYNDRTASLNISVAAGCLAILPLNSVEIIPALTNLICVFVLHKSKNRTPYFYPQLCQNVDRCSKFFSSADPTVMKKSLGEMLVVVRQSQKNLPRRRPSSRGQRMEKIN